MLCFGHRHWFNKYSIKLLNLGTVWWTIVWKADHNPRRLPSKTKECVQQYATVQPDQGNENKRRGISANLRLTLWLKRQSFLHWVWGWGQKFGVLKFRHRLPASLQPTNVLVFLHKLLVELTLASSLQYFVYFTLEHRKRLIILEEIKTMWNADLPSQRKQTPKSEKG